jgi:hypothetical protein
MRGAVVVALATVVLSGPLAAQENKPVPKDSLRVLVPGCAKGRMFTVGSRTAEHPGSVDIQQGTHLRMAGPKNIMAEIKAHEGSMIEITGLMKKDQYDPNGARIGGVRISPGPAPTGTGPGSPIGGQVVIDVEGWRPVVGDCPSR